VGSSPAAAGRSTCPASSAPAKALELVLDGRSLTSAEALEIGLVARVHAPEDLIGEASRLAGRLASRSPESVAAAKRAGVRGIQPAAVAGAVRRGRGPGHQRQDLGRAPAGRAFADDLARFGETPFLADEARWQSGSR
jgi:enoyl-CoA hydratase/carnithine racemase